MSDYVQVTLFTPKDSLVTGNPAKKIRGAEFDPEFAAISAAIQTKYDSTDIASNAEAAALSSDAKLITPAKLKHALENGSVTLGASVLLNGGIAATDVARLSQANTFTSASQTITVSGAAAFRLNDTSQTTDEKFWSMRVSSGAWALATLTDAGVVTNTPIIVDRAGTVASTMSLGATTVTINGTTVNLSVTNARVNGNDILHTATASTGTGNLVYSASPTLTGTLTAATITASGNITSSGQVGASTFSGSGVNILNLNATNISTGTIDSARLPSPLNTIVAGTFFPTMTAVNNCSVTTTLNHRYLRVGNIITFSGSVTINVTSGSATLTTVEMAPVLASNFTSIDDANGAGATNISNGEPVFLSANITSNRVKIEFYSTTSGSHTVYYSGQYSEL